MPVKDGGPKPGPQLPRGSILFDLEEKDMFSSQPQPPSGGQRVKAIMDCVFLSQQAQDLVKEHGLLILRL